MSEAIWRNGSAFWLLWLLPVLVGCAVFAHLRVRRAALQFAGRAMTPRLLPPLDWRGPLRKTSLFVIGLVLAIVAAARPAWDVYYLKTGARGLDLVVALDVSRSMLADDSGDSRLGRARSAVSWLVRELGGDRVGLLVFAGQTAQACPLTLDRGFFEASLASSGPQAVGRGGTKIGPALEEALRMLDTSWDRDKLVLLVTDGGDQESFPKTAAKKLRQKGIRVITLGLGRAEKGAPLVLDGKIVRRKDGQPVLARLNDQLLKELAVETEGMYVPPEEAHRLPDLYRENFGHLHRGANQELQEKHYHEKFQWFLAAAFLLLLLQAGRSPYPRRGSRPAPALAALLLAALVLLPGCGRDTGRIQAAIDQLAAGDADGAEKLLLELAEELPRQPVVAYDLACAHQAKNRRREARARYVGVLETGDKKLRARARTNLAMLAAESLRSRIHGELDAVSKDARAAVRQEAEAALDDLQRARELDPTLAEAVRRQDLLARWLRAAEDAWRESDRRTARAERAKRKGAAYLAALIEAQHRVELGLARGDLLGDLELTQRDLIEDTRKVQDHFADEGAELGEAFRQEVASGIKAVLPTMEETTALLRDGQTSKARQAIVRAQGALIRLWILWTDPGSGLARAAREQARFAQGLAQQASARTPPGLSEDAIAARVLVAEKARELLGQQEERIASWVANLRRRLAPAHASGDWSPLFLERARARLPAVETHLRRASAKLGAKGPQSIVAARRALQALQGLALEWQLAQLEPAELARRLETEQRRLVRAAHALGSGQAEPEGVLAKLGSLAEGFLRSLAWGPIRSSQADQADRVAYLAGALDRMLDAKASKDADENAKKQLEAQRAMLKRGVADVGQAMARAAGSMGITVSAGAVAAMHEARVAVRGLWGSLSGFEALLRAAAQEQAALAGSGEDAAKAEPGDTPQMAKEALAFQRDDAAREQGVTTELVERLRAGLSGEVRRTEEQLALAKAAPDRTGGEKGDKTEQKPAVDLEELEARLAVLRGLDDLLEPAAGAARLAADGLAAEPPPATFDQLRTRFQQAAPEQRRAADLLARAMRMLEEARLPLAELARRIMEGERRLLQTARELRGGHRPKDRDGTEITWKTLQAAQKSAGSYVERLAPALDRELARLQKAKAPAQPDKGKPQPEQEGEEEKLLRALVTAVESAHAGALRSFDSTEREGVVDALGSTLDASRRLWASLANFQQLLERATEQEAALLARSEELSRLPDAPAKDRDCARKDQARTAELVPPLRMRIEAMKQQAPPQGGHPQSGAPPGGGPGPGLPPEVIQLAESNLPAAEQAMAEAGKHIEAPSWNDALDRQEEAHRLLREILDKLRQQQEKRQDQPDRQPQRQQQALSPAELQRLRQAVRERNKRRQQRAKRTPVEEDW